MTIDPTVDAAFAHLAAAMTHDQRREAEAALLSAVRTAHLQELAGETERETLEEAVEAVGQLWTEMAHRGVHAGRTERETVKELAPILTAPLRAKLQQAVAAEREKYAGLVKVVRDFQEAWKHLDTITPLSPEADIDEWQEKYNAAISALASVEVTEESR